MFFQTILSTSVSPSELAQDGRILTVLKLYDILIYFETEKKIWGINTFIIGFQGTPIFTSEC